MQQQQNRKQSNPGDIRNSLRELRDDLVQTDKTVTSLLQPVLKTLVESLEFPEGAFSIGLIPLGNSDGVLSTVFNHGLRLHYSNSTASAGGIEVSVAADIDWYVNPGADRSSLVCGGKTEATFYPSVGSEVAQLTLIIAGGTAFKVEQLLQALRKNPAEPTLPDGVHNAKVVFADSEKRADA